MVKLHDLLRDDGLESLERLSGQLKRCEIGMTYIVSVGERRESVCLGCHVGG